MKVKGSRRLGFSDLGVQLQIFRGSGLGLVASEF